ncbi:MAG TPA: MFS transporter [Bryobacteraceae bacterium]
MPASHTVDVSQIVERQKFSGFFLGLVLVSWIITFFDGFDTNVNSFAAPYFATQFHLTKIQIGNLGSIGLFGTMVGGFILSYLGDRIGRRPAVLLSATTFGILTLCFYFVNGYQSLFLLRFLDGLPLGGLLPLAWALNIEYSPRRYRATAVTVNMMGYSLGTALGGPLANYLIPAFGWKSVFLFGGCASLLGAALLAAFLPESIRFLASKGRSPERIAAIVRRIAPEQALPPDPKFVVADEDSRVKDFKPALLFRGELRWITPMLWLGYIASSMAVFFIVNWTPLVFEALKYTRKEAALAASMNSAMGALGGLLLMRFTDKYGARAITVMPVITTALLLFAGFAVLGHTPFLVLSAAVGAFLIGGHFGMHSVCGIFYPSAYRANGAGWAVSVAKIGSIAGPALGGMILSTSLPVRNIYAVLAVCPAVYAVCVYTVGRMHTRILGREELAAPAESALAAVLAPGLE